MARAQPLVADTGGLLRALARRGDGAPAWPDHQRALISASRVIVPSAILPEIDYFLRDHRLAMRRFMAELFDAETSYQLEVNDAADLARAVTIDLRFAGLGLGLVDAVVATVAERRRVHRVLTIDHQAFGTVRVGERFRTALEIVP